jgi:hypothetical protein
VSEALYRCPGCGSRETPKQACGTPASLANVELVARNGWMANLTVGPHRPTAHGGS